MSRKPFDWRRTPGLPSFTLGVFLFLYAPLTVLVAYSFNGSRQATIWGGFSLQWFRSVVENPDIAVSLQHSLVIAVAATILSTAVAISGALGLARGQAPSGTPWALGVVMLPLVVPEIVVAITTLIFFSAIGLRLGLGNLIIAHTVFCIPFALLPILARLREIGSAVEDAARDLYANEWRVFRRVTLPLLMPAIISGAMLAFVASLDDFMISMMVADAGQTTLPVYIYGMMRLGVTPEVNAISALLLAASIVVVFLSFAATRWSGKRA